MTEDHYFPIDLLNNPAEAADGPIDILDFPSGGNYRKGSDVLDQMIQLERVKKPTKRKDINSRGKEFLDSFLIAQNKEAGNEPGQLPSIQSAQSDAGQFNLQAPNPGAAQPNEAIYNPFAGQYYIDEQGRKIERNPTNSSLRSGG